MKPGETFVAADDPPDNPDAITCDSCGKGIIHDAYVWQALRAVNVHGDALFIDRDDDGNPPEMILCSDCIPDTEDENEVDN